MTTYSAALDFVYGVLNDEIGYMPVIYEGAPNNPKMPKSGYWARASVRGVIGRQTTLGSPINSQHDYEQVNMLFVQLFVGRNEPNAMAGLRDIAQLVQTAYRGVAAGQAVWFRDATIREQPPETDWYSINVTVEYNYTETS